MRVGAAYAEGADTRSARLGGTRPRLKAGRDVEGRARKVDGRVRCGEVRCRRNHFVVQRKRCLDEPGRAGRRDHVAHVALERTERAEAQRIGVFAIGTGQRLDFDRVAHWRGRAVRFYIRDAARLHVGRRQRGADHGGLAVHAGRGKARLGAAVVVDGGTAQHRVDGVAVGLRVGQALQQNHGGAVAEHGALGLRIEAARAAVGREHRALLVEVAAARGAGNGRAARQRHIALARAQRMKGMRHGHQRCRAGGVHAHRGAGEVEPVGHPRGDVVLLVGEHHLELAHGLDEVGPRADVALEVAGVVHAGIHAHGAGGRVGHIAGTLQALPADLEEHALLRVHQCRFLRADAEEGGVEVLDAFDHAAGAHIGRVAAQGLGHAGVERLVVEEADGVAAGNQVVPELLDIRGARKAARGGDQRHGILQVGACLSVGCAWAIDGCGRGITCGRQLSRHRGRRRIAEEEIGRKRLCAVPLQIGQHLQHAHRIAAQVEEVVVAADLRNAQCARKGFAHALLGGVARLFERLCKIRPLAGRFRQGLAVELAVGGDRQLIEPDLCGGQQGRGQAGREVRAQRLPRELFLRTRDKVGDKAQLPVGIGPRDHGAALHRRMGEDGRFHLAGFDAVAVDLDLPVAPADELEGAVGEPARKVARAVEALARCAEGVGHEAFFGQRGLPQIAARQSVSADAELAHQARGKQGHRGAQHPQHRVVDGPPERHRAQVGGQRGRNAVGGREGGAFGGAVAVAQRELRKRGQRAPHMRHRKSFAAGKQVPQAGEVRRVVVDHRVEQRRREPGGVHVVACNGAGEAGARGYALVVNDAAAAIEQRAPDFERGGIEAERRGMQHRAAGSQLDIAGIDLPGEGSRDGRSRCPWACRSSQRCTSRTPPIRRRWRGPPTKQAQHCLRRRRALLRTRRAPARPSTRARDGDARARRL